MTEQDAHFMRLAIDKALEGVGRGNSPFGATIVKGSDIVTVAHNVVWETTDITAHAEVNAIRLACKRLDTIDLSGCTLYSTTEPCPMCFSAIHWAKIDKIVYACTIADAQIAGFSELTISNAQMKEIGGSPVIVVEQYMRDESLKAFHVFNNKPDKRVY
jgi:guanine deaminase